MHSYRFLSLIYHSNNFNTSIWSFKIHSENLYIAFLIICACAIPVSEHFSLNAAAIFLVLVQISHHKLYCYIELLPLSMLCFSDLPYHPPQNIKYPLPENMSPPHSGLQTHSLIIHMTVSLYHPWL